MEFLLVLILKLSTEKNPGQNINKFNTINIIIFLKIIHLTIHQTSLNYKI